MRSHIVRIGCAMRGHAERARGSGGMCAAAGRKRGRVCCRRPRHSVACGPAAARDTAPIVPSSACGALACRALDAIEQRAVPHRSSGPAVRAAVRNLSQPLSAERSCYLARGRRCASHAALWWSARRLRTVLAVRRPRGGLVSNGYQRALQCRPPARQARSPPHAARLGALKESEGDERIPRIESWRGSREQRWRHRARPARSTPRPA